MRNRRFGNTALRSSLWLLIPLALAGCGTAAQIAPTPTIAVAPTQTRAAELAQMATLTAPTATATATTVPTATPLPPTPTATLIPTATMPPLPTATPVPPTPVPPTPTTAPPMATPVPPTATAVPPPPAPPFQSSGLGRLRPEWEQQYGKGIANNAFTARYKNDDYILTYYTYQEDQYVMDILRQYRSGAAAPLETARGEARALIPPDARFLRTYTEMGDRVDVYMSASLSERYPPRSGTTWPWRGEEPGTFIIVYGFSSDPKAVGRVYGFWVLTGNNP